jgi:hypothetical protein
VETTTMEPQALEDSLVAAPAAALEQPAAA